MDQRSIKPGMRSANLSGMRHPKTGELLEPIGYLRNGTAMWPVIGAAPDDTDEDDPTFTGGGGGSTDDEDDDEDDDDTPPKKPVKKTKKTKDTNDEDDEDEEDEKLTRPERQAARYRVKLRQAEAALRDTTARLKALEDKDRPEDEVVSRDLSEARAQNVALAETNRTMTAQLAFFKGNDVVWEDPSDAFTLAEKSGLFDDVIDEDGNVDTRELRRGLRELAKRKPHLVKKTASTKGSAQDDDSDDDQDDEEPRSKKSASTMNTARRGSRNKPASREELAKKFPVLNRL